VRTLAALALPTAGALADPVDDAVQAVLEATRSGADLKAVAARLKADRWLVADALCRRREFEAAAALASAVSGADNEGLAACVGEQRAEPTAAARYTAFEEAPRHGPVAACAGAKEKKNGTAVASMRINMGVAR